MTKGHAFGRLIGSLMCTMWTLPLWAVPKLAPTTLPVDNRMVTDANRDLLQFLARFPVQPDTDDPNLYYYTPTFVAVPREGGAASVLLNNTQLVRGDEIDRLDQQLMVVATMDFTALGAQVRQLQRRLAALRPDAPERGMLLQLLNELRRRYADLVQQATEQGQGVPPSSKQPILERLGDLLASAGVAVGSGVQDTASRQEALSELGESNGGVLTANLYSGLNTKDLGFVRAYKEARARLNLPELHIVRLPVTNLTWGSLTETVKTPTAGNQVQGTPLWRSIAGGGGYEGATINLDLTLDGAHAFQTAPPPLVLPIYAKGLLLAKYPAFSATLSCNFGGAWRLDARDDIKAGLLVYHEALAESFVAMADEDATQRPCRVSFTNPPALPEAARAAARHLALRAVRQRLEGLFLFRSNLSMRDRYLYWQGGGQPELGAQQTTFWHTDLTRLQLLREVQWEEPLLYDGASSITVDLPTSACLVYNPDKKVYFACSEDESSRASSTTDARIAAATPPLGQTAAPPLVNVSAPAAAPGSL